MQKKDCEEVLFEKIELFKVPQARNWDYLLWKSRGHAAQRWI